MKKLAKRRTAIMEQKPISDFYAWPRIVVLPGAAAMHINTNHTNRLALARVRAAKTPCTQSGSDSSAERVGLMPYIGVGTFWVAALLRSSLRPHKLPDSDRADPQP
ncbi:MAG: hypothetical protein ACLQFF_03700 [Steroidobacteraceae bacterium]